MPLPEYFMNYSSSTSSYNNGHDSEDRSNSITCHNNECNIVNKNNGKIKQKKIPFDKFFNNIQGNLLNMGIITDPSEITSDLIKSGQTHYDNDFENDGLLLSETSSMGSDIEYPNVIKPKLMTFSELKKLQK